MVLFFKIHQSVMRRSQLFKMLTPEIIKDRNALVETFRFLDAKPYVMAHKISNKIVWKCCVELCVIGIEVN
jgi:hypothetical protein